MNWKPYKEWKKRLADIMILCIGKTVKETKEVIINALTPFLERGEINDYMVTHEDENKKCVLKVQIPLEIIITTSVTSKNIRSTE